MNLKIRPRSAWGAAKPRGPLIALGPANRFIIHHAESGDKNEDVPSRMLTIQGEHMNRAEEPAPDFPYTYFISFDGQIWHGCYPGTRGWHTGKNNAGSIGICFQGNKRLTAAQKKSGLALLEHDADLYQITMPANLFLHSDKRPTTCPGPKLTAWVNEVRANWKCGDHPAEKEDSHD